MENILNQEVNQEVQTTTDDDFFFEELQEESSQHEEAESEEVETVEDGEQTSETFLNIVYNGTEEALTREEAINLAQKGRNYDKVLNRLNTLEQSPELMQLKSMADAQGVSVGEFLNRLNTYQETSDIRKIAAEIKTKYPDVNDELILSYAKQVYSNQQIQRKAELEQQRQMQMQQEDDYRQQVLAQEIAFMQANYPKVDLSNLPSEVINQMQNGVGLVQSYLLYENKMLRDRERTNQLNQTNAKKNVGNITSNLENQQITDPFLQGFFGK